MNTVVKLFGSLARKAGNFAYSVMAWSLAIVRAMLRLLTGQRGQGEAEVLVFVAIALLVALGCGLLLPSRVARVYPTATPVVIEAVQE